jgi:predicted XRE-type DNA-binding protein
MVRIQDVSEAMTKRKIEAHKSSGNIFADLRLSEADGLLLKSDIVIELHRLIKTRKLTRLKAAKLLGITQPDLSHLLRGDFEDYSAERLMKMLTVFEQDVEIVMKPHRQSGVRGRITFKPARLKRRDVERRSARPDDPVALADFGASDHLLGPLWGVVGIHPRFTRRACIFCHRGILAIMPSSACARGAGRH